MWLPISLLASLDDANTLSRLDAPQRDLCDIPASGFTAKAAKKSEIFPLL